VVSPERTGRHLALSLLAEAGACVDGVPGAFPLLGPAVEVGLAGESG